MAKEFAKLIEKSPKENVLIVDALNLAFRWKHKKQFDFASDYVNTVKSLARSYKCGSIVIAADWGSSSYRKELLPSYKQNREDLRATQTEKEKEDFTKFMEGFKETLSYLAQENWPILRYKGVEADDIAGFLTTNLGLFGFSKAWLVSSDRDWDLLVTEDVSRFSYVTTKETTVDTWDDMYDVPPEMYLTFKCLTGDKGDNVPGITGIGPARATKLISQYGNLFDIYDACPIGSKYKFIQELNANADLLLLNAELMDLVEYCEVAIGSENVKDIIATVREYRGLA